MTEKAKTSVARKPEVLQQQIFEQYKSTQWDKYDEHNIEQLEDIIKRLLVNVKENDVKAYINTIKRLTTCNENRAIYISLVILQFFPNIKTIEEIRGSSFKREQYEIENVIKIRKCLSKTYNDITEGCCVYFDKFGRIYDSWEDFKKNNQYRNGILVGPEGGIYRGSQENEDKLKLEHIKTPDLEEQSKQRSTANGRMDFTIAVVAILLLGQHFYRGDIDSYFILAAETTTFASAIYGSIVSYVQRKDMKSHHVKSNDLFSWVKSNRFILHHIAVVMLGLARIATTYINMSINSGYTIGIDYKAVYDGIIVLSLIVSGISIVINASILLGSIFIKLFKKSDKTSFDESIPTSLEVFMLFSSILYFCNVYATVYGVNLFSEIGQTSSDPVDDAPLKKPTAGGRGRRGKAQNQAPAKGAEKVAEKASSNAEEAEKILTFNSSHFLFLVIFCIFFPMFQPWLPMMEWMWM